MDIYDDPSTDGPQSEPEEEINLDTETEIEEIEETEDGETLEDNESNDGDYQGRSLEDDQTPQILDVTSALIRVGPSGQEEKRCMDRFQLC